MKRLIELEVDEVTFEGASAVARATGWPVETVLARVVDWAVVELASQADSGQVEMLLRGDVALS